MLKIFNSRRNGAFISINGAKSVQFPVVVGEHNIVCTEYTNVRDSSKVKWIDISHQGNNIKSFALTRDVELNDDFEIIGNYPDIFYKMVLRVTGQIQYLCDFKRYNIPIYSKLELGMWVTMIGNVCVINTEQSHGIIGTLQVTTHDSYLYIDGQKIDKTYYLNFNPIRITDNKSISTQKSSAPPEPPCLMSNADFPALKRT